MSSIYLNASNGLRLCLYVGTLSSAEVPLNNVNVVDISQARTGNNGLPRRRWPLFASWSRVGMLRVWVGPMIQKGVQILKKFSRI